MINTSWLESIAGMVDYDQGISDVLESQSEEIQIAYRHNDQAALTALFGMQRFASKQEICC